MLCKRSQYIISVPPCAPTIVMKQCEQTCADYLNGNETSPTGYPEPDPFYCIQPKTL